MKTLFDLNEHTPDNDAEKYLSEFQTPAAVRKYIISLIPEGSKTILEPTPGLGLLAEDAMRIGYNVTAPIDFFCLLGNQRYDAVIMNPPFSAKYTNMQNAPANFNLTGMKSGYWFLSECMKMSDCVIALMPMFLILDSDVRLRNLKAWGIKSITTMPRKTFSYCRIQTAVFELSKEWKRDTVFNVFNY